MPADRDGGDERRNWSLAELRAASDDGTPAGGLRHAASIGREVGGSGLAPAEVLGAAVGESTERPASDEAQLEE